MPVRGREILLGCLPCHQHRFIMQGVWFDLDISPQVNDDVLIVPYTNFAHKKLLVPTSNLVTGWPGWADQYKLFLVNNVSSTIALERVTPRCCYGYRSYPKSWWIWNSVQQECSLCSTEDIFLLGLWLLPGMQQGVQNVVWTLFIPTISLESQQNVEM